MATATHPSFKGIAGPRVTALIGFLLEKYEVVEPGTGTVPTLDSILQDEGLQRMIINMGQELHKEDEEKQVKKISKKSSPKKSSPKKDLGERNTEGFDEDRCSARKWEAEGGLGYDNIQCSSSKKVSKEDAKQVLLEFEEKMNKGQLENMDNYLENYDGCFCKLHMKQDFFMPNGWWLGKVNEDRPEKPMLPTGSFKDGYQDNYKEHFWMYDLEGKKVEKPSKKKIIKKKKKTEEPEAKVEKPKKKIIKKKKKVEEPKDQPEVVEEPKVEEPEDQPEVVEEPKVEESKVEEPKVEEPKVEEPKVDQVEEVDSDETEPLSSDDESYEAEEYIFEGTEYMKVWDEDEKIWIIVDPESQEMVGFPDGEGGITPA